MRFVMGNKVYYTEKSEVLGVGILKWFNSSLSFVLGRDAYSTYETTLYRTKNGNYFFVREGDYGNFYAKTVFESEAKDWLMKTDYDSYVSVFGELEEA